VLAGRGVLVQPPYQTARGENEKRAWMRANAASAAKSRRSSGST
jgi:hypothetical protein